MYIGHLEGEQPYLGDLRSQWLLTTYKSWNDPAGAYASISVYHHIINEARDSRTVLVSTNHLAKGAKWVPTSYNFFGCNSFK